MNTTAPVLPPCKECGKVYRYDFDGYCMDCADENGISEIFPEEERKANLTSLAERPFTPEEKEENMKKMNDHRAKQKEQGKRTWPTLGRRKTDLGEEK